jgi:hypothetical protein
MMIVLGQAVQTKNLENLYLKVVFVEENEDTIVITQHWTDVVK